jgi:hypothetical protein
VYVVESAETVLNGGDTLNLQMTVRPGDVVLSGGYYAPGGSETGETVLFASYPGSGVWNISLYGGFPSGQQINFIAVAVAVAMSV